MGQQQTLALAGVFFERRAKLALQSIEKKNIAREAGEGLLFRPAPGSLSSAGAK